MDQGPVPRGPAPGVALTAAAAAGTLPSLRRPVRRPGASMLDLTAVEVALGLGFVFLVFSLVISRVNEAVAGVLQ